MTETTSTEKTAKSEGAPAEKAGKSKKTDAREMARDRGRVKKAKAVKEPKRKKEKPPREEQVVFAFRLTKEQRDAIHAAAGPAKASQFVLAAALSAAAKK